ncbi:hypothetical protein JCM6882_005667 [Rhodosporidiobolus microsporus]
MAAAGSEEDDRVPRRTTTPLARLDSQRAECVLPSPPLPLPQLTVSLFSPHHNFPTSPSASSSPFGSPASPAPLLANANTSPRARRPSPKSAGSASLPAKPQPGLRREESWEEERGAAAGRGRGGSGSGRRASLRRIEMTPRETTGSGEGPFEDPLRSDWGASRSDISSLPPVSPELDFRRRGSAVSTSSALSSYSPHHTSFLTRPPNGSSIHTTSRHSISSFGGYTLNTIGDMSNSSMPLLVKQPTRESQHTTSYSPSSSRDGRPRATTTTTTSSGGAPAASGRPSSAYSFSQQSDASSVHSYPPRPRQRTRSTTGSSENGEVGGGGSWARELERTSATGQIKRERTRDSPDAWPAFVTTSYIHQPVARPAAAYQSSLSSYSFPGPSTRTPPIPVNPLAPLRKRLARSLASTNSHGRRLHTEVQLLLELIDALEHCITSFAPSSSGEAGAVHRTSGDSNASSSSARPSTASSSLSMTSSVGVDDPLASLSASTRLSSTSPSNGTSTPTSASAAPSSSTGAAAARSGQSKSSLVDEVRLLVRELVELVPDASRCLVSGQYGPLSRPGGGASTKALLASLVDEEKAGRGGRGAGALEWWPRRLARDCRELLDEAGLQVGVGVGATAASSVSWLLAAQWEEEEEEAGEGQEGGAGKGPGGGGKTARAVLRKDSSGSSGTDDDLFADGSSVSSSSSRRREELLMQGKQRWEAYKAKAEALKLYEEGPAER